MPLVAAPEGDPGGTTVRSSYRLLAIAVAAALLVGACAGSTTPSPSSAASAGPVRGGTFILALWQEPVTLAPHYRNQTAANVAARVVTEGLSRTDTDGNYLPVLAKQIPTTANGGVKLTSDGKIDVTWELVPGLKWSDGDPVTSADIKFTWQVWMKDPNTVSRTGFDQIETIDTPNDTTAVIHYKTTYAAYQNNFTDGLIPKHLLENVPDISKHDYNRKPIGTGPFKVTEFVAGDHITTERNPLYRLAGKPYLDKLIFKSVPSREVAVAQLKAGEIQGMWNLLEAQTPDLEKDAGIKMVITPSPSVERIEMNTAKNQDMTDPVSVHPVLGDINVRRALIQATPKQDLIDKLLFGKAKPGTSPVSQGWASPKSLTQEGYDPNKAKQLLDQAGWVAGSDGIRSKAGVRASLTITTTTGDQTRERVEQILIEQFKSVGVELKIQNQPSSVLLSGSWSGGDPRKRGSFDLVMYASSPAIDPHNTVFQRYYSKNIPSSANGGNGQNYTRFKNADADKAIEEAGSTLDLEKRKAAYAKALQLLNEAAVIDWLYERAGIDAHRANVVGWQGNVWDNITWNSEEWYLKPS